MTIAIYFFIITLLSFIKEADGQHSFFYLVSIAVAAGFGIISILKYNWAKEYPPDWEITRHILLILAIIALAIYAAV